LDWRTTTPWSLVDGVLVALLVIHSFNQSFHHFITKLCPFSELLRGGRRKEADAGKAIMTSQFFGERAQ